ncbi:MAG: hypothetical protein IKE35_07585 [Lachnospiraceae bacterium]|nr:hypothetical protein [Lachnospiraceae bacterium]MBR2530867.1 hypothetical protein [Lachnospiraceae bacterium]
MKNLFTKNPGLKIISVLAAFFLWLVVVNVDDPIISKTYTGVPVEILNEEVLTDQGKCYEVLNDSANINVVVTAHRSVLDGMSKDYIKATADLKMLTTLDTVPIEVRSVRFSDRIESVTTRETGVKLSIENLIKKEVSVLVGYEGEPAEGYMLAGVENALSTITVSGPESVVSKVSSVMAVADIQGINSDFTVTEPLYPYDANNEQITDDRLILSRTVTEIKYIIYATKTIPISSGYSGNPAPGFGANGTVITEPSSVLIAGRGENFEDMEVIYISPDQVSVEGATSDVTAQVNISDYLPSGVIFADTSFDPNIRVKVGIEQNQRKVIDVPLSNITVENVPEGYIVNIVDIGGTVPVEIQGIGDAYDRYSGDLAIGKIDAASLVPRAGIPADHEPGTPVTGESDGTVSFDFPAGVSLVNPVTLMVVVDRVDASSVMPAAGGAAVAE